MIRAKTNQHMNFKFGAKLNSTTPESFRRLNEVYEISFLSRVLHKKYLEHREDVEDDDLVSWREYYTKFASVGLSLGTIYAIVIFPND